jgi:DNA-binding PadR family transcriptional regulator
VCGNPTVPSPAFLGEFEQMVLLAILRCREERAFGLEVRRELEAATGRRVSRGAFYTTLDRLDKKGYVRWSLRAAPEGARGGLPRRRFRVTAAGLRELRASRSALLSLWKGLEDVLKP